MSDEDKMTIDERRKYLRMGKKENERQIDDLRHWIAQSSADSPAIIGGDFNAPESRGAIARTKNHWLDTFRVLNPNADATTHELRLPWGSLLARHRLDYIFLRQVRPQWKVVETSHLRTSGIAHSDHLAVFTRLKHLS